MITIKHRGDFSKTYKFLNKSRNLGSLAMILEKYGRMGVSALSIATPRDSGLTAGSWSYQVVKRNSGYAIEWSNSSENQGVSIALIIQYGHGLQNGSYVEGRDYINPAMAPIFNALSDDLLKEVANL